MSRIRIGLALAGVAWVQCGVASAAELWFADQRAFPGVVWHAVEDRPERLLVRRQPGADPAFPRAVMKVAQVAAAPDGAFYFCSGLDGYVLGLLDQRHEVLAFEFPGQVRDLACGGEDQAVYFSVVRRPRDGEPRADGKIYRRDLWQGAAAEVATIRQTDVGGHWWGTFTVREGVVILATTEPRSRLFRVAGGTPEPIFRECDRRISGLEADGEEYLVADGDGRISRTRDFAELTPVRSGAARFSDVTVRRTPGE